MSKLQQSTRLTPREQEVIALRCQGANGSGDCRCALHLAGDCRQARGQCEARYAGKDAVRTGGAVRQGRGMKKALKRYPMMKPSLTAEEIWKYLQAAREMEK